MRKCHSEIIPFFCILFVLICLTGCVSSSKIDNSTISPVYVTNTRKFYLLSPACIAKPLENQQLLSGSFGESEFSLLTYLQADSQGIFLSLFNDFGVGMGELSYDGMSVNFSSAVFPAKLKAEYIVADLQFAYYTSASVSAALEEIGLSMTEEVSEAETVRTIRSGSRIIEIITIGNKYTNIKNLLRGYEYNLQEAE